MISFDACLSFSIAERQQGETVGERLNCFMGVIMLYLMMIIYQGNDYLMKCAAVQLCGLYILQTTRYNQPLIFLFSLHCWATPAGSEDAAFQEVLLRFQLTNELTFISKATVQTCQSLPLFPKRERMMKNRCNIFVISKLSEEVSIFE